jgi:hypothetical protein
MTEQKQAGRPTFFGKKMPQYKISLPESLIKVAKRLGKGKVSAGVRKALEMAERGDNGQ